MPVQTSDCYLVFVLGFVIIIGVFGNLLNLIVFGKKSMRNNPIFRLLAYLAGIDILVLMVCTSDLLLAFNFKIHIRLFSSISCRLHTFLTGYLTQLSSIMLMVVSIERAFLIQNKHLDCFKLKNIENLVISVILFLAFVNIHYLYYFQLNFTDPIIINGTRLFEDTTNRTKFENVYSYLKQIKTNKLNIFQNFSTYDPINKKSMVCFQWSNSLYNYFYFHIWNWVENFIYSYIPILVMAICSTLILLEINKKNRRLNINPIKDNNKILNSKRIKKGNQILLMLVSTNMFFIICSIPYCISHYNISFERTESDKSHSLYLVHTLAYSNNALNFVFYLIFSERYRKEAAKLFRFQALPNGKYNFIIIRKKKVSAFDKSSSRNESINEQIISMKEFSKEPKSYLIKKCLDMRDNINNT